MRHTMRILFVLAYLALQTRRIFCQQQQLPSNHHPEIDIKYLLGDYHSLPHKTHGKIVVPGRHSTEHRDLDNQDISERKFDEEVVASLAAKSTDGNNYDKNMGNVNLNSNQYRKRAKRSDSQLDQLFALSDALTYLSEHKSLIPDPKKKTVVEDYLSKLTNIPASDYDIAFDLDYPEIYNDDYNIPEEINQNSQVPVFHHLTSNSVKSSSYSKNEDGDNDVVDEFQQFLLSKLNSDIKDVQVSNKHIDSLLQAPTTTKLNKRAFRGSMLHLMSGKGYGGNGYVLHRKQPQSPGQNSGEKPSYRTFNFNGDMGR